MKNMIDENVPINLFASYTNNNNNIYHYHYYYYNKTSHNKILILQYNQILVAYSFLENNNTSSSISSLYIWTNITKFISNLRIDFGNNIEYITKKYFF